MSPQPAVHTRSSLRILPEQADLRRPRRRSVENPFLDEMQWPAQPQSDPPRALRALSHIVDGGLCHRCGSCVGICPTGVLAVDAEAFPRIQNLSACTDCDLCVKVCPGDEFNFEQANQERFGKAGNLIETHGHFTKAVIAYAADSAQRERGTSGGLVTALLLHLLETKEIDGALIIGSDEDKLWKGKPVIARTPAEVLAASKSKYAISPTNTLLSEIRNIEGRYAVVGLPCQIHGVIKAMRLDERLRKRIALTVGLFCHAAIEHEAFEIIWDSLGDKAKRAVQFTSRIGKHPGAPHIELDDGTIYPVYFGDRQGYRPSSIEVINVLYRLYTPDRCLTCFDALSEFADIAVGDPWLAPPEDDVEFMEGWTFALLRTARGREFYEKAVAAGKLVDKEVTRGEALSCNSIMATEKRWRAFRVIETQRRQGKPIPHYQDHNLELPEHSGLQFIETELHILTHIFCFMRALRGRLLRFFLGPIGYWLFWVNNKRRRFRDWRRDTSYWLRRKTVGRK
ncbi:MAG: Coenzyme F420 hydrogenase/dehydrogenase, beta subunit C-terminal domain [Oligoflexia bacterium]|nr:Coenzyme F420 hydrogenase/dehydrogenase, beta subunit C-terminal domain [Oligoflexia bacterium]